jgi:hypothetical protein
MGPYSTAKLKPKTADPILIIGFDAEWVTEPPDPLDDDDTEDGDTDARDDERLTPDQIPHNRILSYQYACRFKDREWSGIVYTRAGARLRYPTKPKAEIAKHPERITFAGLLKIAIAHGKHDRHLTRWPKWVIAAAHWTRADLSAMADYASIKRQFDGVQKTYVTLGRPYNARANVSGHLREFRVSLVDTQLLVPGSSKGLASLGDLYSIPKLDPGDKSITRPDGTTSSEPYIEHMDWLLSDDCQHYEAYAIRDAEISARHVDEVLRFVNSELRLNFRLPPATLGSLAAKYLVESWRRLGVDADAVLDGHVVSAKRFNPTRRRYISRFERLHTPRFKLNQSLADDCFHGGRNECFCYGPTVDTDAEGTPPFREYDLISAYAVAMASIRMPDWGGFGPPDGTGMYHCSDLAAYAADTLGIARVSFRFHDGTRFPSLPVVAPHDRGLIYPLEGEAYVTAAEIAVARRQGAHIEILDGVIIPWRDGGCRPFMTVIEELQRRRQQHPKCSLPNEMFKQLANSIYGKLGQGIKGTSAYNTRSDSREKIGPCEITNPYFAAYIAGMIRALISELLAGIPRHRTVVSVTTDAFITNAELGEIDVTGPVATFLAGVKRQLTGDDALLEAKFEAGQLLSWRTRGVTTLKRSRDAKPKLARGGMREPGRMPPDAASDWFARKMLLRQPGDKWSSMDPPPFPAAHRGNADHVFQERWRAVNFEFDMKRRPLDPEPRFVRLPGDPDSIIQHIAFDTVPWRTIEEFNEVRERFDEWRLKSAARS